MAVAERGDKFGSYTLLGTTLFLLAFFASSVYAANVGDTIYKLSQLPDYNGSEDGYIMVWDADDADYDATALRAAFSANRPSYKIGKTMGVYIRTDGYYSMDCGWWYTVPGADVGVAIYYPNNTFIKSLSGATGQDGVWEDETALKLTKSYPMGTYKLVANATKSGLNTVGDAADGNVMTIYVDVAGELYPDANVNATVNKSQNVSVWGYVRTEDGSPYTDKTSTVHIGVIYPDETYYEDEGSTDGNGFYNLEFNATQIGRYFIVVTCNSSIDAIQAEGRSENNSVALGEWPEAGIVPASFPPYGLMIVLISLIFVSPRLLRGVKNGR
jgi:hypothetical protein